MHSSVTVENMFSLATLRPPEAKKDHNVFLVVEPGDHSPGSTSVSRREIARPLLE